MRGDPGSKTDITVVRPGRAKPMDIALVRERIELKPVKWEVKDQIGYININSFTGNVADQTKSAMLSIDKATGGKPIGYIVDLALQPRRAGRPSGADHRRLPRRRRSRLPARPRRRRHRADVRQPGADGARTCRSSS